MCPSTPKGFGGKIDVQIILQRNFVSTLQRTISCPIQVSLHLNISAICLLSLGINCQKSCGNCNRRVSLGKDSEPDLHHDLGLLANLGDRVAGGDLDVELSGSGCQNPAVQTENSQCQDAGFHARDL